MDKLYLDRVNFSGLACFAEPVEIRMVRNHCMTPVENLSFISILTRSRCQYPPNLYHGPYIPTSSNRVHLGAFEVGTAFATFMGYRLFRRPPMPS